MRVARLARQWCAVVVFATTPSAVATAAGLDAVAEDSLRTLARSPATAMLAVTGARGVLRGSRAATDRSAAWAILAIAAGTTGAPPNVLEAFIDSLSLACDSEAMRAIRLARVAEALADVPGREEVAFEMASVAMADAGSRSPEVAGLAGLAMGKAQLAAGRPRDALATLQSVRARAPDSQAVLVALSNAHERLGERSAALDYAMRARAAFLGADSTGLPRTRQLWFEQHGTLNGLEARLDTLRRESLLQVALSALRDDGPELTWTLPAAGGRVLKPAAWKGRVVVLGWWAPGAAGTERTWRAIRALSRRYPPSDVAFGAIGTPGVPLAALAGWARRAGLPWPIAADPLGRVAQAHRVDRAPTLLVLDRAGRVRYRTPIVGEAAARALEAQIEALRVNP